jgi:hypothetical protein
MTEELCVYMVTVSGGKDGRRYIPIHDLCSSLSNITCQILPSLICSANPKWKEVNLFLLTDTMHSAKDKHFRSFPIGTEVLSFADSKAESSSSQHVNIFKEEGSLAPEFEIETSSGARAHRRAVVIHGDCFWW